MRYLVERLLWLIREVYSQVMSGGNTRQAIDTMKKEIEALQTNRSTIQITLRSVLAREKCLQMLSELVVSMEGTEESNGLDSRFASSSNMITKVIFSQWSAGSKHYCYCRLLSF